MRPKAGGQKVFGFPEFSDIYGAHHLFASYREQAKFMNKNVIYLVATILAVVIIGLVFNHEKNKTVAVAPTALPVNGLVGGTTTQSAMKVQNPAVEVGTVAPANSPNPTQPITATPGVTPAAPAAPAAYAVPEPAPAAPVVTTLPNAAPGASTDMTPATPASPLPTAAAPKPADDKGLAIPASEGQ
jgi:hypothetical protein